MALTKEQKKELAMKNLSKSWEMRRKANSPKTKEEVEREGKVTINKNDLNQRRVRKYLDGYLDRIASIKDFEKVRKVNPKWALEFAWDRVIGRPNLTNQSNQGVERPQAVAVLVKILCGNDPAGPKKIGIDGQEIEIKAENNVENQSKGEENENDDETKPI